MLKGLSQLKHTSARGKAGVARLQMYKEAVDSSADAKIYYRHIAERHLKKKNLGGTDTAQI